MKSNLRLWIHLSNTVIAQQMAHCGPSNNEEVLYRARVQSYLRHVGVVLKTSNSVSHIFPLWEEKFKCIIAGKMRKLPKVLTNSTQLHMMLIILTMCDVTLTTGFEIQLALLKKTNNGVVVD